MKIQEIFAENYAKVGKVSVSVDPNLTYLIGSNASGKSTIGHGVPFFVMKGLAQRGDGLIAERFRFIGPAGRSAKGGLKIIDEVEGVTHKITRKLRKDGTELTIESSDGVQRGQEFLDGLWSAILYNVMAFSKLSGKEQALAFGIDTSEFDAERKELEKERKTIRQDLDRLEAIAEASMGLKKVEEVSIQKLLRERKEAENFNEMVAEKAEEYQDLQMQQQQFEKEIHDLRNQLQVAEFNLTKVRKDLDNFELPPEPQDLSVIDKKLAEAEGVNEKARAYQKSLEDQKAAQAKRKEWEAQRAKIKDLDAKRAAHIAAGELPFSNTTINEDGEFRLNDKPFNETYYSRGECMKFGGLLAPRIVAKDKTAAAKKLLYVYIPHIESLDEDNRAQLLKTLADLGLQVLAEFVTNEKQKDGHTIMLKEMSVVEDTKAGSELT